MPARVRWSCPGALGGRGLRRRAFSPLPPVVGKAQAAYAVMVPMTNAISYRLGRERVEQLGVRLTGDAWRPAAGAGAQGEPVHDWACVPLSESCIGGMRRWLLVRRDPGDSVDPDANRYWLAYGPAETTVAELVRVCDVRWQIEGRCSCRRKGMPTRAWITTRCAPGKCGTGSSRSALWRMPGYLLGGMVVLRAHALAAEPGRKRGTPHPG